MTKTAVRPVTFSNLRLQKCYAYQNGVEFSHEHNGDDVSMLFVKTTVKPETYHKNRGKSGEFLQRQQYNRVTYHPNGEL